jgi:hypothetical protein
MRLTLSAACERSRRMSLTDSHALALDRLRHHVDLLHAAFFQLVPDRAIS